MQMRGVTRGPCPGQSSTSTRFVVCGVCGVCGCVCSCAQLCALLSFSAARRFDCCSPPAVAPACRQPAGKKIPDPSRSGYSLRRPKPAHQYVSGKRSSCSCRPDPRSRSSVLPQRRKGLLGHRFPPAAGPAQTRQLSPPGEHVCVGSESQQEQQHRQRQARCGEHPCETSRASRRAGPGPGRAGTAAGRGTRARTRGVTRSSTGSSATQRQPSPASGFPRGRASVEGSSRSVGQLDSRHRG